MVLDTFNIEQDVLVFKNTYDDPDTGLTKKFEIERTHQNAPKEFYFVHIEVDMVNLQPQDERQAKKQLELMSSPLTKK